MLKDLKELKRRLKVTLADERGAALYEYALVLFLYAGLIFFVVTISWWWWNQAVASSAIHDGVRTAGARYGDLVQGQQVAYERLHIALGRLNADEYGAGLTVWSDPARRAVQGQAQAERTLDVPFLSPTTFWVQVGSFQRKWQFYGGPPSGWE